MDHSETQQAVVFSFQRWKLVLYVLLSIALAGMMFYVVLVIPDGLEQHEAALIWFSAVFLGIATLLWISQLFHTGPVVIVQSAGITDKRISADIIPWDNITTIKVTTVQYQSLLTFEVDKTFARSFNRKGISRFFGALNQAFGWKSYSVSMNGLNGSVSDLIGAVHRFAPNTFVE